MCVCWRGRCGRHQRPTHTHLLLRSRTLAGDTHTHSSGLQRRLRHTHSSGLQWRLRHTHSSGLQWRLRDTYSSGLQWRLRDTYSSGLQRRLRHTHKDAGSAPDWLRVVQGVESELTLLRDRVRVSRQPSVIILCASRAVFLASTRPEHNTGTWATLNIPFSLLTNHSDLCLTKLIMCCLTVSNSVCV